MCLVKVWLHNLNLWRAHSLEANSCQIARKYPAIYVTQILWGVIKKLPLCPTLGHMNPVHAVTRHFLNILFTIILLGKVNKYGEFTFFTVIYPLFIHEPSTALLHVWICSTLNFLIKLVKLSLTVSCRNGCVDAILKFTLFIDSLS
jgi:hypothetical protein